MLPALLSGGGIFRFFVDYALCLSAPVSYHAYGAAPGRPVPLCGNRVRRSDWLHGEKKVRLWAFDFGAWDLYQGEGRRANPCQVGGRNLQKYLD